MLLLRVPFHFAGTDGGVAVSRWSRGQVAEVMVAEAWERQLRAVG